MWVHGFMQMYHIIYSIVNQCQMPLQRPLHASDKTFFIVSTIASTMFDDWTIWFSFRMKCEWLNSEKYEIQVYFDLYVLIRLQ